MVSTVIDLFNPIKAVSEKIDGSLNKCLFAYSFML